MDSSLLSIDPRLVREGDFPAQGTPTEQWSFLLNYALLAPSEYNTQPWLFRLQDDSVEMYADYTRGLPVVDPHNRELLISCGAACYNLRLAARHFGYLVLLVCFVDNEQADLLVRLHLGAKQATPAEEDRLFPAIVRRQSNRMVYEARDVPSEEIQRLRACAGQEGTWLELIQDARTRKTIADLIIAGDRRQWADKRFRHELAEWVHPRETSNTDGLPGDVRAKGSFRDMTSPFLVRTFDLWREEAARDRQLAAGAPVLAVLGTFSDTAGDWFLAGMAIERILLAACASGLQTSFVNQPVEVASLRSWLCQALGRTDFPQMILRIGYGEPAPWTPRRSVREVLLNLRPADAQAQR
jgi:nitroreductase